MLKMRIHCLAMAAIMFAFLSTSSYAAPLPPDSTEATNPTPSAAAPSQGEVLLTAQIDPSTSGAWTNPFDSVLEAAQKPAVKSPAILDMNRLVPAAPAAVPGGSPKSGKSSSSSGGKKTHFEIQGIAQWKKFSGNGDITYNTSAEGGISNTINFNSVLGIANFQAGPLFRFIWTPEKKIKGATSKVWIEYGQVDRSVSRTIQTQFVFLGNIYLVDATLKTDIPTKQFKMGYAPRWGNDKFRIGPAFVFEYLDVSVNLSASGPTSSNGTVSASISVPNPLVTIGGDFEYTPIDKFVVYGNAGAVPCCGGGWHVFESEWGAKYFFKHGIGVVGGIKYDHLRRDFNLAASEVGGVTVGPFSGAFRFPTWGPFVGVSARF